MPDEIPVVIACQLCPDRDAAQIVTLRRRAWIVGVDHLLDHHRRALLMTPDDVRRTRDDVTAFAEAAFTITEDDQPQPLRRSCAQSHSPLRSKAHD